MVSNPKIQDKVTRSKILKHVQNDMPKAQELFGQLSSIEAKQETLLEKGIDPKHVDEFLSHDQSVDSIDVLNDKIIEKMNVNCDSVCQNSKQRALSKIDEVEKESDQIFKDEDQKLSLAVKGIEKSVQVLDEISTLAKEIKDVRFDPKITKSKLQAKIQDAYNEGVIDKSRYDEMTKEVDSTSGYDPESVKETTEQMKYELKARENEISKKKLKNAGKRQKMKSYFKKTKNGIKSMSKTEKLEKTANAISHVASAVSKFGSLGDKSLSSSEKALQATSGVT